MVRFDPPALFAALDTERRRRRVTWRQISREIGVATSTITRTRDGGRCEVDGVLAMVRWLGRTVEDFTAETEC